MELLRRGALALAPLLTVSAFSFHMHLDASKAARSLPPRMALNNTERLLVISPHPDDDILGAGALMLATKGPKQVVYVTAGDGFAASVKREFHTPRPSSGQHRAYARRRQREALAALARLAPGATSKSLGLPDKSLTALLLQRGAHRSPYTKATRVPYGFADTGRAHRGTVLFDRLQQLIGDFRPTVLIVPFPLDTHLDHRALSAFAQLALEDLMARKPMRPIRLVSFPTHLHAWPAPRGFHPQLALAPPPDLLRRHGVRWLRVDLSPRQVGRLGEAASRHRTQLPFLEPLMLSFARKNGLYAAPEPVYFRTHLAFSGPPATTLPKGPRMISLTQSPAGLEVGLTFSTEGLRAYQVLAVEAGAGHLVRRHAGCIQAHGRCRARLQSFRPKRPFLLAVSSKADLKASLYTRLIRPVGAGPEGPAQA